MGSFLSNLAMYLVALGKITEHEHLFRRDNVPLKHVTKNKKKSNY